MKKLIKYFTSFSFILIMLGLFSICYATEVGADTAKRADVSKIAFEWTEFYNLKVKNVNFIEGNDYYIHVSHNKDEKLTVTDLESIDINNIWNKTMVNNEISDLNDIVAENGDIYIWICELDSKFVPKIVVEAKKIDRKTQNALGDRIFASFSNDNTLISCWEPLGNENRKVSVKIGIVTDNSILKAIKNGETNSMQRLLTYAISADSIYNEKMSLGTSKTITKSMNLVANKFYYAYLKVDDENGKYYPIEDVELYQGMGHINESTDLVDRDIIAWDYIEEETPPKKEENTNKPPVAQKNNIINQPKEQETDNTVAKGKLPQTGLRNIAFIASIAAIICIIYIGIKIKKYRDIY